MLHTISFQLHDFLKRLTCGDSIEDQVFQGLEGGISKGQGVLVQ